MKQHELARSKSGQMEPKLDTLQRLAAATGRQLAIRSEDDLQTPDPYAAAECRP
jgi:hypothetical protein